MSSRVFLFVFLSTVWLSTAFAHYPAGDNHRHHHYARQMATPTFEPFVRRSATPTSARHSATPTLVRRSATPVLSQRDALQRRHEFEAYLKRRQAPSPVPSGLLQRRQQVPSPVPSGLYNRRSLPSSVPSEYRDAESDAYYSTMSELSSNGVPDFDYYETNARRIKRGAKPLPPRGFSLQEVGGTLRYLPDQKPSQTIKPEDTEETQDAVVRTGSETRFKPSLPDLSDSISPAA